MWIAAGEYGRATTALERAEWCLNAYGQRYSEGLLLLLRARLLQACGAPAERVRVAAQRARKVSVEREAHLFARRAQALLDELATATAETAASAPPGGRSQIVQ